MTLRKLRGKIGWLENPPITRFRKINIGEVLRILGVARKEGEIAPQISPLHAPVNNQLKGGWRVSDFFVTTTTTICYVKGFFVFYRNSCLHARAYKTVRSKIRRDGGRETLIASYTHTSFPFSGPSHLQQSSTSFVTQFWLLRAKPVQILFVLPSSNYNCSMYITQYCRKFDVG